jgi:hypothetical protein
MKNLNLMMPVLAFALASGLAGAAAMSGEQDAPSVTDKSATEKSATESCPPDCKPGDPRCKNMDAAHAKHKHAAKSCDAKSADAAKSGASCCKKGESAKVTASASNAVKSK